MILEFKKGEHIPSYRIHQVMVDALEEMDLTHVVVVKEDLLGGEIPVAKQLATRDFKIEITAK